jgi:hypothetical protein
MTADPPAQVAVVLDALRPVADEIVVAADSRVDVGALRAYDDLADRLLRFDFRPPVDRPRGWLVGQCTGDWVLSIDGDEVPSAALITALPGLVAAADVQQCWLPRRWLFPDAASWLAEAPWWPDFQVRLMRNDATLAARAELHGGFVAVHPSRHVDAPLYHLDTAVNDHAARAAKAARYEAEAPGRSAYGGGPLSDVMYRPERWASGATRPVPDDDRELIDRVLAARARALPSAASRPPAPGPPVVPAAVVDRAASAPVMQPADYAVDLRLFEDGGAGGPLRLAPGETRPLYVRVANRGRATWRWGLDQQPLVRISHHWRTPAGAVTRYEGLRSPLPCTLGPGESAIVPVWVEAPRDAGDHLLEIDLVHEHVRWFDAPLTVSVLVAERRPATDASRHAGAAPC